MSSPEMPPRETTCEMSLAFWKHLVCTAAKTTCKGIIDMLGKCTNESQHVFIPTVQTKCRVIIEKKSEGSFTKQTSVAKSRAAVLPRNRASH